MIQRVVKKHSLTQNTRSEDLAFWKGKSPEERAEAVDGLRKEHYGTSIRLQRVARVIKSPRG